MGLHDDGGDAEKQLGTDVRSWNCEQYKVLNF